MYQHLFGPVPSRRLGMSLGIDLVPHKVCTLNCIYCECGATTNLTLLRKEYVNAGQVKSEISNFMKSGPMPDYMTFSGAGEPTLNSELGAIIEFIKTNWSQVPVAVLTNGSLLSDPEVRSELMAADLVLPSLDAASDKVFRRIDRPCSRLDINSYIQGIIDFRSEFSGSIWLEVMILPGINDTLQELNLLKQAFLKIRPHRIQLNTLDRPGVVADIRPANRAELDNIKKLWSLDTVEIIAAPTRRKSVQSYRSDMESAIEETIARRPCTIDDLAKILGTHINEINKYLGVLQLEGKLETTRQERGVFYRLKSE